MTAVTTCLTRLCGLVDTTARTGILTLPDGSHVAVSLFVKASTLEVETREAAIADMTRSVYDFFMFTNPPAKL